MRIVFGEVCLVTGGGVMWFKSRWSEDVLLLLFTELGRSLKEI